MPDHRHSKHFYRAHMLLLMETRDRVSRRSLSQGLVPESGPAVLRAGAHLNPYPVVHAQPEEQQGTQEHRLKEIVQHAWKPAVHQKGEGEERIWNATGRKA